MLPSLTLTSSVSANDNVVLLASKNTSWKKHIENLSTNEADHIKELSEGSNNFIHLNRYKQHIFIIIKNEKYTGHNYVEELRKAGCKLIPVLNNFKIKSLYISDADDSFDDMEAFVEGMSLANYEFNKYKKKEADGEIRQNTLKEVKIRADKKHQKRLDLLKNVLEGVYHSRDLVNEPLSYLTAEQLSEEIKKLGKEAGFEVEVFNREKIKALKMGGLLAVNLGSINPPTFNILEWKPAKAKNKKPFVLVGKGVVYDTGGLSLKPTPNSMDLMKSDMAGAAAVAGAIYSIAKSKLPVHVIGLIPATENRPGGNAYVPGDVIKMHNGLTVEVLNTDAEGRLILADALSYAKKYKPELVIDLATLTGAAQRAIGIEAAVMMGTADEKDKKELNDSGFNVFERLVEFPLWKEYEEYIKSDIADLKNVGGALAGATTAGKFLERFTDYPWIHLDIAGPAFITGKPDSYRGKNGTGVGVRLLFDFLKRKALNEGKA